MVNHVSGAARSFTSHSGGNMVDGLRRRLVKIPARGFLTSCWFQSFLLSKVEDRRGFDLDLRRREDRRSKPLGSATFVARKSNVEGATTFGLSIGGQIFDPSQLLDRGNLNRNSGPGGQNFDSNFRRHVLRLPADLILQHRNLKVGFKRGGRFKKNTPPKKNRTVFFEGWPLLFFEGWPLFFLRGGRCFFWGGLFFLRCGWISKMLLE